MTAHPPFCYPTSTMATKKVETKGGRKTMRTTLHLDEAMWKALRIRAIEESVSATRLVERLIQEYLKKRKGDGR